MSDDLVKRLRDVAEATGPNEARQIALDAADRIEELEGKLTGAVAECERIGRLWHDAEAKLAKAIEALEKETGLHRIITTLAELKGEDRG